MVNEQIWTWYVIDNRGWMWTSYGWTSPHTLRFEPRYFGWSGQNADAIAARYGGSIVREDRLGFAIMPGTP